MTSWKVDVEVVLWLRFYCEEGVSLGDKKTQLQMYAERLEKLVLNCNAWRAKVEGAAGYWTAQRHEPHIHH